MTHKIKTPSEDRVFEYRLTVGVSAVYDEPIKAVAAAMTNQLYTISIKSRKPIVFIYALVGHTVSSVIRLGYCSVIWDRMVSWVKCELLYPSVKPSVKRLQATMTSMAPKSMKTVISYLIPVFIMGMGAFNFTITKEQLKGQRC